ncbi:MAG TPA: NAD(P)/FAD-dependent oxidoreductase [Vicinamibacterales bacterium]|nr:NAD(P)/FAD-dependent oxidoreductase [Vicinamibacterales bacterium]
MDAVKFDVAVIGAGPAGAWCATRLSASGLRVALVDGSHPREKACGGGVTGRALALVTLSAPSTPSTPSAPSGLPGLAADELRASPSGVVIRSARFTQKSKATEIELSRDPIRLGVVSRRDFDARLLACALSAGATLVNARARDIERTDGRWRVVTDSGDIDARWLIGADGASGLVRKKVSRPFARQDISIACGYYVHGVTTERIDIAFEHEPAGYLWSFPRRDHLAVGVCAQADVASTSTLMPVVDRWLRANVEGGRLERYSWPIPSLTGAAIELEVPCGDGWLLIGDAAGLVDPITREGIFYALDSARIAAECLEDEPRAAFRYAERLRSAIYDELGLAARLKGRFYRPAFIALLLTSLERSARIRAVMADLIAGEQPYHSLRRRLLLG